VYPAGGERQLIDVLTGVEIPHDRYPSEVGYTCQNVGTALAVQRLVKAREPLVTRVVTVTGRGVASPANVETPIGTPIAELIELCGGYRGDVVRLIHGGSMMGYALPSDELPITKATSCVIAAVAEELRVDYTEWPCIRCGECQNVCPARLQPQDLLIEARTLDFDALDALALKDCIECGCCDVVCPSHIVLTETFRQAKQARREHARRTAFSAESDARYRQREERRHAQTADARARQDTLVRELESTEDTKAAAIKAAVERARSRRQRGG
jgi:electron transport complex protein RnfC